MAQCRTCGQVVDQKAAKCSNCGAQSPALSKQDLRNGVVALLVICIAIAVGLIYLFPGQNKEQKTIKLEQRSEAPEFKAQPLNPDEEKKLIQAAQNQVTKDGATVLQVLRYVEKMRPKEFKIASFEVLYSWNGKPNNVGICYWIGAKRLDEDQYCDIAFSFSPDHKLFKPEVGSATEDQQQYLTVINLLKGRDVFLRNIDEFYQQTCVELDKKKTC
jgi:hypothetical protein